MIDWRKKKYMCHGVKIVEEAKENHDCRPQEK